jgi:D-alanine-D-alanine ligase
MSFVAHPNIDPKSLGKVACCWAAVRRARDLADVRQRRAGRAASRGVDAHPSIRPQPISELAAAGFDRAFIALHGRYGEDGTMQGRSSCWASPTPAAACWRRRWPWTSRPPSACG